MDALFLRRIPHCHCDWLIPSPNSSNSPYIHFRTISRNPRKERLWSVSPQLGTWDGCIHISTDKYNHFWLARSIFWHSLMAIFTDSRAADVSWRAMNCVVLSQGTRSSGTGGGGRAHNCKWRTPGQKRQNLPTCSFLSTYHTAIRYTREGNFNYTCKKSQASRNS